MKKKTNLRDRDDLSTRDIGHFPKASLSRRFHCRDVRLICCYVAVTVYIRRFYWRNSREDGGTKNFLSVRLTASHCLC